MNFILAWLLAFNPTPSDDGWRTDPHLFQTHADCVAYSTTKPHGQAAMRCFQSTVLVSPGLVFPPDQKHWWQ